MVTLFAPSFHLGSKLALVTSGQSDRLWWTALETNSGFLFRDEIAFPGTGRRTAHPPSSSSVQSIPEPLFPCHETHSQSSGKFFL